MAFQKMPVHSYAPDEGFIKCDIREEMPVSQIEINPSSLDSQP